jgi:hypothetical protein
VEIEKEKRIEPNIRASYGYLSKLTLLLVFFFFLKVWKPKKEKGKTNKHNFRAYYGHLSGLTLLFSFYSFSEGVETDNNKKEKKKKTQE